MTALTEDQKQNTVENCMAGLEQARQLRDHLKDTGPQDKYEEAARKVSALNTITENLLVQKLKDWCADANSLLPELADLSDQAQKSIDNVKKSIEVAKNIDEAFSVLDKLIQLAGSITF